MQKNPFLKTTYFLNIVFLFFTTSLNSYEYKLSLCAIFQNEAPYLKEWIDFHRVVGVEHFWLYNHLSDDSYLEVLQSYIDRNIVELIDWPYEYKTIEEWNTIQCSAYNDAVARARDISEWLMVIDTDEFFFPVQHTTLTDFLDQNSDQVCICANWQMYGTGKVSKLAENEFLIEKLILKAPVNYHKNKFGKCLTRPEYVRNFDNPHFPLLLEGFKVDTDGRPIMHCMKLSRVLLDKLRINHYWMRDEKFMLTQKLPRRRNWQAPDEYERNKLRWLKENDALNVFEDYTIHRFLDRMKELQAKE